MLRICVDAREKIVGLNEPTSCSVAGGKVDRIMHVRISLGRVSHNQDPWMLHDLHLYTLSKLIVYF